MHGQSSTAVSSPETTDFNFSSWISYENSLLYSKIPLKHRSISVATPELLDEAFALDNALNSATEVELSPEIPSSQAEPETASSTRRQQSPISPSGITESSLSISALPQQSTTQSKLRNFFALWNKECVEKNCISHSKANALGLTLQMKDRDTQDVVQEVILQFLQSPSIPQSEAPSHQVSRSPSPTPSKASSPPIARKNEKVTPHPVRTYKPPLSQEQIEKLCVEISEGHSLAELTTKYQRSNSAIMRIASINGLSFRAYRQKKREPSHQITPPPPPPAAVQESSLYLAPEFCGEISDEDEDENTQNAEHLRETPQLRTLLNRPLPPVQDQEVTLTTAEPVQPPERSPLPLSSPSLSSSSTAEGTEEQNVVPVRRPVSESKLPITQDRDQQLCADIRAGCTRADLVIKYHLNETTISRIASKNGLTFRQFRKPKVKPERRPVRPPLTEERIIEARKRLLRGDTFEDLVADYSWSRSTIERRVYKRSTPASSLKRKTPAKTAMENAPPKAKKQRNATPLTESQLRHLTRCYKRGDNWDKLIQDSNKCKSSLYRSLKPHVQFQQKSGPK